jgi:hypothetical protein
MSDLDLTTIIEDSLTDAELPSEASILETPDPTPTEPVEAAPEEPEAAEEAVQEAAETPAEGEEGTKKSKSQWEDFDKKFGIDPTYPNSGRENRIPYSRVKKIAQKAVRDAKKEWESEFSPKSQEYETKLKDYEAKLTRYTNLDKVMSSDPERFLTMLSKVPAYQQFFAAVEAAFEASSKQQAAPPTPIAPASVQDGDDMPQPDQRLSDGSMVYSMEGLKALNAWNREQARKETLAEVDKKFGPIESEWQAHKRVESLRPVINAQIEEARTWEGFTDNEAEIAQALKSDQKLSLEGAYRKVVLPKLRAAWEGEKAKLVPERNKLREEILAELKAAPRSTAVPSISTKATPTTGPKSLEDIITEQIQSLKK